MTSPELLDVIREFTSAMLDPYDLDDLLQHLTERSVDVLDAKGAGILLEDRDGNLQFATATNDAVREAERRQAEAKTGACYDAYASNQIIVVDHPDQADRWPGYADWMRELELHAVLGVPLNARGHTIGALNVYRGEGRPWSERDIEIGEVLAAMGAAYLVHAGEIRDRDDLAEQLQEALDSRGVIERAKGMVMARDHVDEQGAFDKLRETSQHANRKLRDIASDLVGRGE